MNAYLNTMRRYATFSGRTSRREFWRALAVLLPLMLISVWVLAAPDEGRSVWLALVCGLIAMPHIVPWAAPARRLANDMDRMSGWALVSLILLIVVPPLGLILLLAWGYLRGTPGSKRYHPDDFDTAPNTPTDGTTPPVGEAVADGGNSTKPFDLIADLERLSLLLANGTLTAAEFEVLKTKTLGQGKMA